MIHATIDMGWKHQKRTNKHYLTIKYWTTNGYSRWYISRNVSFKMSVTFKFPSSRKTCNLQTNNLAVFKCEISALFWVTHACGNKRSISLATGWFLFYPSWECIISLDLFLNVKQWIKIMEGNKCWCENTIEISELDHGRLKILFTSLLI